MWLVLVFIVMGVLFYSSSQTYHEQTQLPLLHKLLKSEPLKAQLSSINFQYADEQISIKDSGYFSFVEFFIRKGAHLSMYFLLGSFWFLALEKRMKPNILVAFVSWQAATGYAGLDEFHQMLTGDRTPLFHDVVLDSVGALLAVVGFLLVRAIERKKRR